MRLLSRVLVIFALVGCSSGEDDLIVGTWSVTETVSNQVYQLDFQEDGVLRQTVGNKTNSGRYEIRNFGEHRELHITWSNESEASIWLRFLGNNSVKFYQRSGEEIPDFTTAFEMGTLTRSSPH